MNTQAKIKEVEKRLNKTHSTNIALMNPTSFEVGQIWTVAGGCGDQPVWHWLLLEELGDDLFNCAPLSTFGKLAGPDDLFIPLEQGTNGIVVLECECTLYLNAFKTYLEKLPDETMAYIKEAVNVIDNNVARNKFNWGLSYFVKNSPAEQWHEAIIKRTEELQNKIRLDIWEDD